MAMCVELDDGDVGGELEAISREGAATVEYDSLHRA